MPAPYLKSGALFLLCLALLLAGPAGAVFDPVPEGDVRFFANGDDDLDPYTSNPTPAEQQWMRDHYFRMLVWSPYFDSRLAWFPGAWEYQNVYGIHTGSQTAIEHEEWILKDQQDNKLYIPFGCSGGTCPLYAADFGNAAYRAWWIGRAQDVLDEGYAGLWIDDVNMAWRVGDGNGDHVKPIDPRTGQEMTLDAWRDYMAGFTELVRATFPDTEIAHNVIWYADANPNTDPYIARQIDAADVISLERGIADGGLHGGSGRYGVETFLAFIDYVHGRGRNVALFDEAENATEREYALAGWFLINDGRDLMGTENHEFSAPDMWWPGYELKLGAASGGRYEWNDLLRRDFACGSAFLNQPDRPTVSVQLGQTYTTIEGQEVTSLTLAESEGAVLMTPCAPADTDADGVIDDDDNCIEVPNPDQCNTNPGEDSFGNLCDPDLDNNGVVNSLDLALMRSSFGTSGVSDADLDCNMIVNTLDLTRMRARFGLPPGP